MCRCLCQAAGCHCVTLTRLKHLQLHWNWRRSFVALQKVLHINNELTRRDLEIQDMRMKLLELSDWNIARTEVMAELDELKNDQEAAALSFKKQIETMEEKYNEEKVRCGAVRLLV